MVIMIYDLGRGETFISRDVFVVRFAMFVVWWVLGGLGRDRGLVFLTHQREL